MCSYYYIKLWETVLQTPYSVEFSEEQARRQICEDLMKSEEGKDWILYLDAEKQTKDLKGHIVEFKVVNNKIVGYGDAQ